MALRRLGVLITAVSVAACVAGGRLDSPDRVSCTAWTDELTLEQRTEVATALLAQAWQADGAVDAPPSELVHRFADAIGNLCQAAPGDTVAVVGQRAYAALDARHRQSPEPLRACRRADRS